MGRTQFQLWSKRFKEGWEDVNDNVCPGRPSSSTTDEVIEVIKKMILEREVAERIGISFGSCQANFIDVWGRKRKAA